jgi:uncharacterized membrane protein YcfT
MKQYQETDLRLAEYPKRFGKKITKNSKVVGRVTTPMITTFRTGVSYRLPTGELVVAKHSKSVGYLTDYDIMTVKE